MGQWEKFEKAMQSAGLSLSSMHRFRELFEEYRSQSRDFVDWNKIRSLIPGANEDLIDQYQSITEEFREAGMRSLDKLVLCKLNGGLGTTLGCQGPKSLVRVLGDDCFLSIILSQMKYHSLKFGPKVPLILLNSFATDAQTKDFVGEEHRRTLIIRMLLQNTFMRIDRESLTPLPEELAEKRFSPPGHGDVFFSLYQSGELERLIDAGKEFLFVSNSDNLGASIDLGILGYLVESKCAFLSEVTERSPNDLKGGVLVRSPADGVQSNASRIRLMELAQVPEDKKSEFFDVKRFPFFNTNNVWVHLPTLLDLIESRSLAMDLIVNQKSMYGHDFVQLEQAMGSAIRSFEGAKGIVVPRSRFCPVKGSNELFLVRSNIVSYKNGAFAIDAKKSAMPKIDLGATFKNLEEFEKRLPEIPDIRNLKSLRVEGDVTFGKNITLSGDVVLDGRKQPLHLEDGQVLDS